jgi:hypothetical protein
MKTKRELLIDYAKGFGCKFVKCSTCPYNYLCYSKSENTNLGTKLERIGAMAILRMFRDSALEFKKLRCITVTAMLIALNLALKTATINITDDLKISFSFLSLFSMFSSLPVQTVQTFSF